MTVLRSALRGSVRGGLRGALESRFGGAGGIRPRTASIIYTGQVPTLTGVAILLPAGAGASIAYAADAPVVSAPNVIEAGAGAPISCAGGGAPTGLGVPDGAIVLRNGDYVIDRNGDYIINVSQAA